ncbi:hypothetical protein DY000_02021553 [Brassica cretica]|uniref:Uncharacterized protein n=1 Tax=Brassica cretica TaxID=69181 RepID=A0ABQ7EFI4_BRACR|nr:hypothetical protein DY000_02021553 [Brassica cretica]
MEFVDDKGEVATARHHHHHHHRSLPPPPSPSLPSPIARYHHHHRHLSHPQSLFTTTIASQIRLHHRHARHNHHCSLLCLSLYVSGGAYRTKRDDSAKTMSQRLQEEMSRTRVRLDSHECCSLSLELPSAAFEDKTLLYGILEDNRA